MTKSLRRPSDVGKESWVDSACQSARALISSDLPSLGPFATASVKLKFAAADTFLVSLLRRKGWPDGTDTGSRGRSLGGDAVV